MNATEDSKTVAVEDHAEHLRKATSARQYLNEKKAECRAVAPSLPLTSRPPLSGPEVGHYCFDYAQQVGYIAL